MIALLVGEITVRWLGLAEPWRPPNPTALFLYHEDPNGPIEMAPNWEGYISFHEEPVRLNRDGFRDREFPANPPPGTTRIAVVGDGYTMGDGIGRGYTYAKQLEEILGRSLSCEVMNCGVTATNSHNQLPIVRRLLADFHPQVIALCYNFNDFSYRRTTFFEDLGPSGFDYVVNRDRTVTITETDLGPRRVLNRKLKQNSHLYRVLRLLRFRPTSQSPRESVQGWIRDEGHLKSFDAVAQMDRACRDADTPFVVFVVPALIGLDSGVVRMADYPYEAEHEMILSHLTSRGIHVFDLLEALKDQNPNDLIVHPRDRHYNPRGCRLIAKAMAGELRPVLENEGSP